MSFNSCSCSCFRTSIRVVMLVGIFLVQLAIIKGLNHVGPFMLFFRRVFVEVGRSSLDITR